MPDTLAHIAAYKRDEVADRKRRTSLSDLEAAVRKCESPRGFVRALAETNDVALIAEIKKASPSKGLIRGDFEPANLARAYAAGGAACLSVLTDTPSFQGDDSYLSAARSTVSLPVLRKEFLVDPWQVLESRALGADAILVILAMVDDVLARDLMAEAGRLGMDALVEVHDEVEMARAGGLSAGCVGINNRDLRSFIVNLSTTETLAPLAASGVLLVAESGVSEPAHVNLIRRAGVKAMLVGESLMRQDDVRAATQNLLCRSLPGQ